MSEPKTFLFSKPLIKGLTVAAAALVVAELNNLVNTGTLPTTVEEWKERGPVIALSLLAGAIKAMFNVYKHRDALISE